MDSSVGKSRSARSSKSPSSSISGRLAETPAIEVARISLLAPQPATSRVTVAPAAPWWRKYSRSAPERLAMMPVAFADVGSDANTARANVVIIHISPLAKSPVPSCRPRSPEGRQVTNHPWAG